MTPKKIIFWHSPSGNQRRTYADLIHDIRRVDSTSSQLGTEPPYEMYVRLLAALANHRHIALTDPDLKSLQNSNEAVSEPVVWRPESIDSLVERISRSDWTIDLYSSGTTGIPKKSVHSASTLLSEVRTGARYRNATWGLCYNPTHIAGLRVFFQTLLNQGSLVNLFGASPEMIAKTLISESVSALSATPSFYRLLFTKLEAPLPTVKQVTFGGERLNEETWREAKRRFPSARIRNIFAATEIETVLVSDGFRFTLNEELKSKVRVSESGELLFKRELVAEVSDQSNSDQWYSTGDLVNLNTDGSFEILGRRHDLVNIGGYLANPHEVESAILRVPWIHDAVVVPRENSVTGYVLEAQVIVKKELAPANFELALTKLLAQSLPRWMIPRKITSVDSIQLGRTGKRERKCA